MNRTETELLKKLSLAFGPSGCEDKVAEIIKEEITPYADEITEDRSGTPTGIQWKNADSENGRQTSGSCNFPG